MFKFMEIIRSSCITLEAKNELGTGEASRKGACSQERSRLRKGGGGSEAGWWGAGGRHPTLQGDKEQGRRAAGWRPDRSGESRADRPRKPNAHGMGRAQPCCWPRPARFGGAPANPTGATRPGGRITEATPPPNHVHDNLSAGGGPSCLQKVVIFSLSVGSRPSSFLLSPWGTD